MECRFKEKVAGSNQSLKAEGRIHGCSISPGAIQLAGDVCTYDWSLAKRLTVTTARMEKWTRSLH